MPRKILVFDDDEKTFERIGNALYASGYVTTMVDDRRDTLSLAKETRPDVIILPLELFQQSLMDMVATLKNCLELSRVPVLLISSGRGHTQSNPRAMSGVQGYLEKPFSPMDLIMCIENALEENIKKRFKKF